MTTLAKPANALTTERRAPTNPAAVYLATLRPTSRYTMMRTLDRLAAMVGHTWQTMPWAQLRYEHVQALRAKMAEEHKAATVNVALSAVRRVAEEAWKLGQMPSDDFRRIESIGGVTGSTLPAGRSVGPGELGAMLRVCSEDETPAGARDAAIIALGYAAGLRRAEIAGLQFEDLRDGGDGGPARWRRRGDHAAGARQAEQGAPGLLRQRR